MFTSGRTSFAAPRSSWRPGLSNAQATMPPCLSTRCCLVLCSFLLALEDNLNKPGEFRHGESTNLAPCLFFGLTGAPDTMDSTGAKAEAPEAPGRAASKARSRDAPRDAAVPLSRCFSRVLKLPPVRGCGDTLRASPYTTAEMRVKQIQLMSTVSY